MRQAITTKYSGPTNSRGARIIARAQAGRATVPWNYALDTAENHRAAASILAARFGWPHVDAVGGALPAGDGYAFVFPVSR